jgi:Uma2 family endonuclease
MPQPDPARMTVDQFLDWQLRQERLHELVDGVPVVPLKMMTGATQRHDRVVVNALTNLVNQLRGKPCRPMTDDVAVRIPSGNIRRPDITVDCGKGSDRDMTAAEPRVVIEVLSPSTLSFDRFRKLEEYKTVTSMQVVILIDTEQPQATVHRRAGPTWSVATFEGIDAAIELQEIDARLALADLYEGLTFDPT